jgi:hypothetical protein
MADAMARARAAEAALFCAPWVISWRSHSKHWYLRNGSVIGVITHRTRGECEPANPSRWFWRFIRGVATPPGASRHRSTVGWKVHIRGDSRVGSARSKASRIRMLGRTGSGGGGGGGFHRALGRGCRRHIRAMSVLICGCALLRH